MFVGKHWGEGMKSTTRAVAEAAGAGLSVYLLRPADWPGWVRWTYVTVPSLLVAVGGAMMTGLIGTPPVMEGNIINPSDEGMQERLTSLKQSPFPKQIAMVAGAGGAMAAAQFLSIKADVSVERWLSGHGVRHPRMLRGAIIAVVSLAESVSASGAERRSSA